MHQNHQVAYSHHDILFVHLANPNPVNPMKPTLIKQFTLSLLFWLLATASYVHAQQLADMRVHDPVMIKQGNTYYLFSTGQGIAVWSSGDRKSWKAEPPVFASAPPWATAAVPGFKGHIWAPDISRYNGKYYLYYSISTFGKNRSAIGLASNPTLDPKDPSFHWTDHGPVLQSYPDSTYWNAIDPNLICDEDGTPYLSFGSFWGGLQLVKLRKDGMQPAQMPADLLTIGSRHRDPHDKSVNPIEAPFIYKRPNGYYYFFASIDYCCKGVESTYKMIVGRSASLKGPYYDDKGIDLAQGGGRLVLAGDAHWHGVGHNAVIQADGHDYLVFHGYDAHDNGKPKLRIEQLSWDDKGWPMVALGSSQKK